MTDDGGHYHHETYDHIHPGTYNEEDGGGGGYEEEEDGMVGGDMMAREENGYGGHGSGGGVVFRGAENGGDQLTLEFHNQIYVFEAVSPDKVEAVLLLLGGQEVPGPTTNMGFGSPNQRGLSDMPCRMSSPQRAASLNRFREKRKERCYEKKIRYAVRKEVALRMERRKGQFTSSRTKNEESGSWNATNGSGRDESHPETLCKHCGTSSKGTPMMRRGPAGPRTLCNACGLMWANKGTLKDISTLKDASRAPLSQPHTLSANQSSQSEQYEASNGHIELDNQELIKYEANMRQMAAPSNDVVELLAHVTYPHGVKNVHS